MITEEVNTRSSLTYLKINPIKILSSKILIWLSGFVTTRVLVRMTRTGNIVLGRVENGPRKNRTFTLRNKNSKDLILLLLLESHKPKCTLQLHYIETLKKHQISFIVKTLSNKWWLLSLQNILWIVKSWCRRFIS